MVPGLAIVVSPLLMLMCDQVARLRQHGINTCYYNTMLSEGQRKNILHDLRQPNCQYEFVFASPEAVISEQFQSCLKVLSNEKRLNFFIIDEAHCVDTWGQDFRPAYQKLSILKEYQVPLAALTGTATKKTLDAIQSALQMSSPEIVKMPCRRENLTFSVVTKNDNKAKQQVADIINERFADVCGIVYCAKQADTVEMAYVLKEYNISSTYYHAGMEGGDRIRNATLW
jgi:superfamily II DNA helicase RecQ